MPGCSSALNTSAPAYLAVKPLMMLRGTTAPSAPRRWPVSITWEISVLISMISPTLALSGSLMRGLVIVGPQLAAAAADRHLDGALGHQEPAVAQLGDADHILRAGKPHAARHGRLARQGRQPEHGHAGLRVGGGD